MSHDVPSSRLDGAVDDVAPPVPSPFPWQVPAPPYERVRKVLLLALQDIASGKGADRHVSDDEPIEQQDTMQILRAHGLAFATGQIEKKSREAGRMAQRGDPRSAQLELLGVMAYASLAWLRLAEQGGEDV
jgi:hypothetical protein